MADVVETITTSVLRVNALTNAKVSCNVLNTLYEGRLLLARKE